ncbi:MAG TPA: hypothetical protein DDZ89_14890 [Clostridiales bacterium]|nr:hypothetical protein [Clostridiales bacterium]
MSIQSVKREVFEKSPGKNKAPSHSFAYLGQGFTKIHKRCVAYEGDYTNEAYERISPDNGHTWSSWKDVYANLIKKKEQGEVLWVETPVTGTYNKVHDHYVSLNMQRLFPHGHHEDYRLLWSGVKGTIDHTYLDISKDLKTWNTPQLVKYENGANYDEDNWLDPEYTDKNLAYLGCNLEIDSNGDILFPIGARVDACCKILGMDPLNIFPSCPHIANGLIVMRGIWNEQKNQYEFHPSKPVIISDLKSSRGVDEPTIILLKSGRIVVVFRGANTDMSAWKTRLAPGTPAHKWYSYSDDGGKTFTDPVPYPFDNGDLVYSPASISRFIRSEKNGKAYWIGNVTPADTKGSYPREPLVMAEVDEKTGVLKKDTYTVIDQRNPEMESERVQLSNFTIFQDRQTNDLEIYLTKIEANVKEKFSADAWKYTITFDE